MMENFAEENLWYRFKEGDRDALSLLYEQYVHKLFSYGVKISADESLVKDCIQEVFIQLIEKRQAIVVSPKTHLYLFKALRNKLLEEMRTKNRKSDIVHSMASNENVEQESIEQSIVFSEEETRRKEILDKAFKHLNDYQREALFLRFSQGFAYEEISEMLDIDVASARTLIYRSLKKVKESISETVHLFFYIIRAAIYC